ncbi:MAG: hypothetical protein JNM42_17950 [Propionivibrio sp.]|uniref:hypothetical protein n=1 Tax=Propionivibrio sp. TaxID=2212460 RepID=UPI001A3D5684|nr:hypothetical protein [Propionivibrio sp.]MBL8416317.1 hypothetical protein [Propionivibrio sp.]
MTLEQKKNPKPDGSMALTPMAEFSAWQTNRARPKRVALLCVATLICSTVLAQQEPDPPLPMPTEAQLQRGRELLDKIAYVITSVSLSDAPAVLKVFGFTELKQVEYPDHVWVRPKGKVFKFAQPDELAGTGFTAISVQPRIENPRPGAVVARFSARFALSETCVTMDDARRVLEPIATTITSEPIIVLDSGPRPKPLHETGGLTFSGLRTPFYPASGITFTFEYQTCAQSFGFAYYNANKETSK